MDKIILNTSEIQSESFSKLGDWCLGPFSVPFPILTNPELENGGQYPGDPLGHSHLHQFNIVNDDLLPKHVLLTTHNYKYSVVKVSAGG